MRTRLALVVAGVLGAASASAYVLEGFDWMWQPSPVSIPWEINTVSFPASTGSVVEIEDGIVGAMDAWSNAGNAYFAWTYGGVTTDVSWTADARMIAQWHTSTAAAATLAVTQIIYYGGDVDECDIRFYGSNGSGPIAWSADPLGAAAGEFDLQKIATHELGHCLGLAHSGNAAAIMYATTGDGSGPSERALHQDDIDGLNAIYTGYVPRPDLDLVTFSTEDLGDGDGFYEAGEIVGVTFVVDNLADADAINAVATLSATNSDVLVHNAIGQPDEPDHPGLSVRSYYGAELKIADGCTLEGTQDYEARFSADNFDPNFYWVFDIDLTCLGPDLDGDGVPESLDQCEGHDDTKDRDGDGVPNRCDPCPDDNPDDSDADGICDEDDICDGFDDLIDTDGDGTPDGCEEEIVIPEEPVEEPAGCGCSTQGASPWWLGWLGLLWLRRGGQGRSGSDRHH